MPSSAALPVARTAQVLQQALDSFPEVLAGTSVALALLKGGVLHFVTQAMPLADDTWAAMARELDFSAEQSWSRADQPDARELVVGLHVGDEVSGFLFARRATTFTASEQALLHLTGQGVASVIENGRLRSNLLDLFDEYMSPEVAQTLLRQGGGSQMGGQTVDISVLFADLRGFTALAERLQPAETVALLNRYFALAAPAIVENGGTVSAYIGDAVMGLFGAPLPQPEHPLLAARAALALQRGIAEMVADNPELPRFRVGVATGPATVGSLGSPRRRVFTAIGDTVNLAARLETAAQPGSIVISAETYATIRSFASVQPMEPLTVKGKQAPVTAYELLSLREDSEQLVGSGTLIITAEELAAASGGLTGGAATHPTGDHRSDG
ncbi:MAG TPA: adenylate/guanylate cyclase domain-containing protein [Euzebya sp.]|nr:adenylate/guanylate cyclase domain-containing protein [Euzebya sp.]